MSACYSTAAGDQVKKNISCGKLLDFRMRSYVTCLQVEQRIA